MSKQSEGMRPSGRNSPFAGRVWAIAEAERGGWEKRTYYLPDEHAGGFVFFVRYHDPNQ